jgi:hypothetical protein
VREPARYLFLLLLIALAGCQTPKEVLVDLDRHVPRAPRLHEVLSDDPGELRQVVDLNTRKGAWQRYLLLSPKAPKAAAILFAGGGGEIEISSAGGIRRYGNFLIRSRHEFVANGIAIAITDVPSDKNSLHGLNRYSAWHLKDIEGVVADFGKRVGLPVWLIGTSRGALSAAYGGAYSRVLLAGIVLTASMTEVTDVPFEKIGKGLVVHHRNDECHVTPPHYAKTIAARLGAKPVYFEGGLPPISSACQARAAHGFLGIEPAVVRRISDFIKTN